VEAAQRLLTDYSRADPSLHPHHPSRLKPQIRHHAFFSPRCAGLVQAADFQRFFSLFGASADTGDIDAAAVEGGAGRRVQGAARGNDKEYEPSTRKPVGVTIF